MPVDLSQVYRAIDAMIKAGADIEDDLRRIAQRRAEAISAAAQRRLPTAGSTPYATGRTREAVHVVEDLAHHQYRVEVADVPGRDPMVPVYIEFGTVGTPAKPFIRPAVDENRAGYLDDITRAIIRRFESLS